jgi:hypothetical protein
MLLLLLLLRGVGVLLLLLRAGAIPGLVPVARLLRGGGRRLLWLGVPGRAACALVGRASVRVLECCPASGAGGLEVGYLVSRPGRGLWCWSAPGRGAWLGARVERASARAPGCCRGSVAVGPEADCWAVRRADWRVSRSLFGGEARSGGDHG